MRLKELDRLDYADRLKAGIMAIREAADPTALYALFEGADPGYRRLAILGAAARRDTPRLLAGLRDASVLVRRTAAAYVVTVVPVEALLAVCDELDPTTRKQVEAGAVRRGNQPLVVGLLARAMARGDGAAVRSLVRGADGQTIKTVLSSLDVHGISLSTIALHHPDFVLEVVGAGLEAAAPVARGIWWRKRGMWRALAESRPDAVLALLNRFAPADEIPEVLESAASRLGRRRLAAVVDFLLAPGRAAILASEGVPHGLLRVIRPLDATRMHTLAARLLPDDERVTELLAALAPSRRAAVFEAATAGIDTSKLRWTEDLLAVLPVAVRQREAARVCALPSVLSSPWELLELTAYRAYADALPRIEVLRGSARAEERARGWRLRIACAGLDAEPQALLETLGLMIRLENEQDPVRAAAWLALAALPISRWDAPHIPALEALVGHTLEARDTSYGTRDSMQRLAIALLKRDASEPESLVFQFALDTLGRLAGQTLRIAFPLLWPNLLRGAEHPLCAVVLPWVQAASRRDYKHNAVALAWALGKRARGVEALQAQLKDVALNAKSGDAGRAITLWLDDPKTRDERVRLLLDRDKSTIVNREVFEHLHRRRTSWLDPFLAGKRLKGRFASGRTAWLPPATGGFYRWSAPQQRAMAELLTGARGLDQWSKTQMVRTLALLPITQLEDMEPYLKSSYVPTKEAALGATIWLDEPAPALPVLLRHLNSSRARVAMYALPRLLKLVPRDVAVSTLAKLLAREKIKVTVHKEALRLLGALGGDEAFALLLAASEETLHRDVHIALLHATRTFLDRPEAWALMEAAQHGDRSVALSLLDPVPTSLLPQHRPRYLSLLLQLSAHPDAEVRRALFGNLAGHQPGARDWASGDLGAVARVAASRLLVAEESKASQYIAQTLAAVAHHPEVVAVLAEVVEKLQAWARTEAPEPGDVEDLPGLSRLRTLLGILTWDRDREAWRAARVAVAEQITEGAAWPELVALWASALRWTEPAPFVAKLLALVAGGEASELARQVAGQRPELLPEDLQATVDALAKHPHPSLRRVAVALIEAIGDDVAWPSAWVARMVALRRDPEPLVAFAARRVQMYRM